MEHYKTVLLWGPTGFGKTSFIKTFTKNTVNAIVGDGRGYSTTQIPEIYEYNDLRIIDTAGSGDAQLRKSDSQMRDDLIVNLMDHYSEGDTLDCLLIFESFMSDRIGLIKTLESVQKVFGNLQTFAKSVIVVYTKFNLFNPETIEERVKATEEIRQRFGCRCLWWKSHFKINGNERTIDEQEVDAQIQKFYQELAQCQPIPLIEIKKLKNRIEEDARILEAQFLAEVERRIIQMNTQRVEEYQEEVERERQKVVPILNERYDDVEKTRQETEYEVKSRVENQTVDVPVTHYYSNTGPGFFQQIFGLQKSYSKQEIQKVNIPVTKYEVIPHQVEKKYMDKELRYDVTYKTEYEKYMEEATKYRVLDEMVDQEVEITKSKPEFDYFRSLAKKKIMDEFKKKIKNNLNFINI